jgi:hypothetical protein
MEAQKIIPKLNLHTEFSYLNTAFNERFLSQKVNYVTYMDKDIISNGSSDEDATLSIVYSGGVRIIKTVYGNDMITSYDLGIGDIFGIENILCGNTQDFVSIISAVGETVICRIHKQDILEQLSNVNALKGLFRDYIKTMNRVINP